MITDEKIGTRPNGNSAIESEIMKFLSQGIRSVLGKVDFGRAKAVEEIRLRANKPLMLQDTDGDYFVDTNGKLGRHQLNSYIIRAEELNKTLELMSENSIYAYQDEIKNGFITLKGGHRVGIAGKVVLEGNLVKNIKDIGALNIRVSREVQGCSDKLLKYLVKGSKDVFNTLIVSPPQCGKTTMLRDIARSVSDGIEQLDFKGIKVGVVDERSEIAACYRGIPQNCLGVRTDVLDGCPKALGMTMMLRSMSPQVIITDEIGNQGDRDAVMKLINAGVKIITTAHGYNISELKTRQEVISLIEEKVFERFIVLSSSEGPGTLEEVIDGTTMKAIYRRG